MLTDNLCIANKIFTSRLFIGTGKFQSNEIMSEAISASETEMVTIAMKRVDISNKNDDMLVHILSNFQKKIHLLPNTSGARTAKEAIFAAQLAQEAFETN